MHSVGLERTFPRFPRLGHEFPVLCWGMRHLGSVPVGRLRTLLPDSALLTVGSCPFHVGLAAGSIPCFYPLCAWRVADWRSIPTPLQSLVNCSFVNLVHFKFRCVALGFEDHRRFSDDRSCEVFLSSSFLGGE
jgi:hypothetical protein